MIGLSPQDEEKGRGKMRDMGWCAAVAAIFLYCLYMTLHGGAGGAMGLMGVGVYLVHYKIKERMLKLALLVSASLLLAYSYYRFSEAIWFSVFLGMVMILAIYFNDYKDARNNDNKEQ